MKYSEFLKKVDDFFAQFNGASLDYDGKYGAQCKDVFSEFNCDWLGLPYLYGNAIDLWYSAEVKKYYDLIPNTATSVPQKGDFVIWGGTVGKYYENGVAKYAGHVDMATGDGDTNRFKGFDQNWPAGSACHFQEHNYSNVVGYLRPKNIHDQETPPPPPPPPVDPRDATIVELQNKCNELSIQVTKGKQDIYELGRQIDKWKSDYTVLEDNYLKSQNLVASLKEDIEIHKIDSFASQEELSRLKNDNYLIPKNILTRIQQVIKSWVERKSR